jgi:NTE family protein
MSLAIAETVGCGVSQAAPVEFGLALGGGGARGLAHVAMLEVCDELGVRPGIIAGTSIGALVGAAYCSGLAAKDLRDYARRFFANRATVIRLFYDRWNGSLWDYWNPLTSSLFTSEKVIQTVIPPEIPCTFKDLKIPLIAVTTDFHAQAMYAISEGELLPAIAASAALPALMTPVRLDGRILVDGGLTNPLPFDLLKGKARIVGAVDVSGVPLAGEDRMPRAMEIMITVPMIALRSIMRAKMGGMRPDILVRPDVGRFGTLEFRKVEDIWKASLPAKEEFKRQLAAHFETADTAQHTPLPLPAGTRQRRRRKQ